MPKNIVTDDFITSVKKAQAKERRREKNKAYARKCASQYMEEKRCRACGGPKEDEKSLQHCDKCKRRRKSNGLQRVYGITIEDYEELAANQNWVCWICGNKETSKDGNLAVDHCHKTGNIRGLLCFTCNAGIGSFQESELLLNRAIEYLKEFNKKVG